MAAALQNNKAENARLIVLTKLQNRTEFSNVNRILKIDQSSKFLIKFMFKMSTKFER